MQQQYFTGVMQFMDFNDGLRWGIQVSEDCFSVKVSFSPSFLVPYFPALLKLTQQYCGLLLNTEDQLDSATIIQYDNDK